MDACDIQSGHAVLDIGCGSGTTSIEIARRVGAQGRVIGVDISTPMLGVGHARLEAFGIDGVTFENKDVATYPFEAETFDRTFSRFGVMFFVDPVAAFTNIRGGMKPGRRLAFACWQAMNKNPWLEITFKIALRYLPAPPPAGPKAPGPLAFADPERVREILSGAGFGDIHLESLETKLPMGPDVPASVERLVQLGPAGRLLGDAPGDVKARVADDLGGAIAEFQTDRGVVIDSAAWIVSATSP
jgi:SAM-dependent methyltransferase